MKHYLNGEAYDIPREPQAYMPTVHFGQMKKERSNPPITGTVINKCITEGGIGRSKYNDACYRFVWTQENGSERDEWTMVVALNAEAFEKQHVKHEVLTAYVQGKHDYQEWREKWDK